MMKNKYSMRIIRAEPLHQHYFRDEQIGMVDNLFLKRKHDKPNFNRRMFDEDFARLFHSMSRRSSNLFDIVSNDDELTQSLFGNVKMRYAPHSVNETVRRWVEEIAQSLIWFGRAYYFLHDDPEHEDVHIASFGSNGVARFFGVLIQWVPKRTEQHWDRDNKEIPREIRILDAGKIMRFAMPGTIKRMLSAQNKTLAVLDKHQYEATEFHPQATHENPNPINHFNFGVWRDTQERALYRATRGTGWKGRKFDSTKHSDFFDCHRLIRFRRNQLMLRDDILRQFSSELSRVGKGYNAGYSVEISATDELPSIEHLDELEARLTREEVAFTEIVNYCFES
ncbi:hypothetical protein [Hyphococcus sp. DH-69]|uniref:hypothetical protein n=1 Tax=Hyphococcus formosus TaxID=3143534 RepID=UPI00398BAA0C